MQRGRKPKTIAERKAAGNPSKRPLTTLVPQPMEGAMLCPNEVNNDGRARDYWDMFLANTAPGHLRPLDAPLLARLCMCLSMADRASEEVSKTGMLVKARNGLPVANPYMAILNKQADMARKFMGELALPPAMRNRIGKYDDQGGGTAWDAFDTPAGNDDDEDEGDDDGVIEGQGEEEL